MVASREGGDVLVRYEGGRLGGARCLLWLTTPFLLLEYLLALWVVAFLGGK